MLLSAQGLGLLAKKIKKSTRKVSANNNTSISVIDNIGDEEYNDKTIAVTKCLSQECSGCYTDTLSESILILCKDPKHDPSGEEMDKVYKRKFGEYGLYNVYFQRKAVTKEQWERFDLLKDPDPDTLEKLQKDPNRFKFMEKYRLKSQSELFAIQLEAMQTPKVRTYLKNLVQSSIDQYFNEAIYQQVIEEHLPGKIREIVYSETCRLLESLNIES